MNCVGVFQVLENFSDAPMTPKQILHVIQTKGLKEMRSDTHPRTHPHTHTFFLKKKEFLKEVSNTVCPFILNVLNSSLSSVTVPYSFKNAVIQPLLKKPGLNSNDFNNFRPISKLPLLFAKVLENIVANILLAFLSDST